MDTGVGIHLAAADFSSNFVDWLPGFIYDFTTGSAISNSGTPLLCGRTTTARQVGPSGAEYSVAAGTVRFARNRSTGVILGLLAEPAATNQFTYNSDLTQSYWTKHNCTVSLSSTLGTDGVGMYKIAEDNTNTYHGIPSPTYRLNANGYVSCRVYAKAAERSYIYTEIGFFGGSGGAFNATINLTNGTYVTGGTVTGRINVVACINGIYLIEMTASGASVSATTARFSMLTSNGTTNTYTGTTGSGVYVQYPQYEISPRSTSTIITSGSAVTRDADNYYVNLSTISSLFNPAAYTLWVQQFPTIPTSSPYSSGEVTPAAAAIRLTADSTSTGCLSLVGRQTSSLLPVGFGRGSSSNITLTGTSQWTSGSMKLAFSSAGVFGYAGNAVSASGFTPSANGDRLQVGSSGPQYEYFEGIVTGLRIYQGALSASDLQKVTT